VNAGELFKANKLREAVEAQVQEVKARPADHARRLFLFELLVFAGDLDRAQRQIDAQQYEEPELQAAQLGYRRLLDAERARRRLFSDGQQPEFLADPPEAVRLRLEAVQRLRAGRGAEAAQLLGQADAAGPALQGQLNGKPIAGFRDCDDLFGGVLEVMAHGNYYWVPLEHLDGLTMAAPRFPRDLIWAPARLELKDSAGDVFLPVLYPGSHEHPDDQVKLGRMTDWRPAGEGPIRGLGQRVFLAGDDGVNLTEVRELRFGA
jgi:type VI secretion system protein ImpE